MNIVPRKRYDSLDYPWCDAIERSTYCFDGHKQLSVKNVPWEGVIGFDPDEIEHEKSLENSAASGLQEISMSGAMRFQLHWLGEDPKSDRTGYASVTSEWVDKCSCDSGLPENVCTCHISSPVEEFECKDMLEAIRKGLVTLAYAIRELGEMFRHFLEIEDPELAELAVEY
jgi:hypothetical protein